MASATIPFEEPRASKHRGRASTSELLPRYYDGNAVYNRPNMEPRLEHYSVERLQQRLAYAQSLLSRHTSPRCELFMHFYKMKIKDAITAETRDQWEKDVVKIMKLDHLISKLNFLNPSKIPDKDIDMQNKILKLRKMQYLYRYMNRSTIVAVAARADFSSAMFDGCQYSVTDSYWSNTAHLLFYENELYEQRMCRGDFLYHCGRSFTSAIMTACTELGISYELVIRSIMEFDSKNSQICDDLGNLRKDGKHGALAKTLYFDKAEINMIFSEFRFETHIAALEKIIQRQIDTWFYYFDPDDPETWVPTESFLGIAVKARETRKSLETAKRPSKERSARKDEPSQSAIERKTAAHMQEPPGPEKDDGAKQDAIAKRRTHQMLKNMKLDDEDPYVRENDRLLGMLDDEV